MGTLLQPCARHEGERAPEDRESFNSMPRLLNTQPLGAQRKLLTQAWQVTRAFLEEVTSEVTGDRFYHQTQSCWVVWQSQKLATVAYAELTFARPCLSETPESSSLTSLQNGLSLVHHLLSSLEFPVCSFVILFLAHSPL